MSAEERAIDRARWEAENNFDGHCYTITQDTFDALLELAATKATPPDEVEGLREALIEAKRQLEYLDDLFQTSTTPAAVAKIEAALTRSSPDCQKGVHPAAGWASVRHDWWVDPFGAAHCHRCERSLSVDDTRRAGITRSSREPVADCGCGADHEERCWNGPDREQG